MTAMKNCQQMLCNEESDSVFCYLLIDFKPHPSAFPCSHIYTSSFKKKKKSLGAFSFGTSETAKPWKPLPIWNAHPGPTVNHNRDPSQSPFLAGRCKPFLTLRGLPCSPRDLSYVSNQPFRTLFVCVCVLGLTCAHYNSEEPTAGWGFMMLMRCMTYVLACSTTVHVPPGDSPEHA